MDLEFILYELELPSAEISTVDCSLLFDKMSNVILTSYLRFIRKIRFFVI